MFGNRKNTKSEKNTGAHQQYTILIKASKANTSPPSDDKALPVYDVFYILQRADELQTEQKRRKLKNFNEASLLDKHSITLRGLQYMQLLWTSMMHAVQMQTQAYLV